MAAQSLAYMKNHLIVNLERINFVGYKLYLNFKKKKTLGDTGALSLPHPSTLALPAL